MQLYTKQDYEATKKALGKRGWILAAILLGTCALVALFLTIWRNRIAADATAVVGMCAAYFYLTVKLMPWYRYWSYQNDMRQGLSRETEAWFISCSKSTREADGVEFREFIVHVEDEEDNERLFFWDNDKVLPEIKEGQKLHIRSFGNYITELNFEG